MLSVSREQGQLWASGARRVARFSTPLMQAGRMIGWSNRPANQAVRTAMSIGPTGNTLKK